MRDFFARMYYLEQLKHQGALVLLPGLLVAGVIWLISVMSEDGESNKNEEEDDSDDGAMV